MRQEALDAFARSGGDTLRLGSCRFTAREEVEVERVVYRVVVDAKGGEVARHLVAHTPFKPTRKEKP